MNRITWGGFCWIPGPAFAILYLGWWVAAWDYGQFPRGFSVGWCRD